jgi:hypothetical protein
MGANNPVTRRARGIVSEWMKDPLSDHRRLIARVRVSMEESREMIVVSQELVRHVKKLLDDNKQRWRLRKNTKRRR